MLRSQLLPRLGDILFASILAGALILGQRMLNIDSDLGRHLTLGRYMLETGQIPARDILSFTLADEPRPPYEWLAQAALALVHKLMQLDGVLLLVAALIATAYAIAFGDGLSRSHWPLLTLAFTAWAALAGSVHWVTRPHVFSFLFLAIWMRLLERLRQGHPESAWQLPIVMLFWANAHGGFVTGFIAWAAYLVGSICHAARGTLPPGSTKSLLLAGAISGVASVVTPDLWNNWTAVLRNTSTYVLSRTAETAPPSLGIPGYWPFYAMLLTAVVLAWIIRRRVSAEHVVLLFAFGTFSLLIARNIPIFALAAAPILANWAATALSGTPTISRVEARLFEIESSWRGIVWPPAATITAILLIALSAQVTDRRSYDYSPAVFPVRAADWAEANPPQGRLFNDLNWGGYLLYRLWPVQRVFIDSQTDFYGEALVRAYESIITATPGWDQQLAARDVAWIVVRPQSALADEIRRTDEWDVAFEDATGVIFLRRQP